MQKLTSLEVATIARAKAILRNLIDKSEPKVSDLVIESKVLDGVLSHLEEAQVLVEFFDILMDSSAFAEEYYQVKDQLETILLLLDE
ncbi:hypothetical protein ACXHQ0_27845 [Vibrio antiquarius]|uniref:Uncharacterized protein n=1 Tax=Vibrio parahaemolyticus TaxID=670 RepID=A0AA46UQH7_VIBPH|nr:MULTISPECIES: hypothetical protein [Vibrio harveyi group]KOE82061.1 hypothetical protein ACS91_21125 [Vibrio parahaemolyticus]MCS0310679.1 hypothetical protein [Vibrio diabolicus]UYV30043.1 hypothetical protein M5598_29080 [Vibrio parahaemolyticus]UYW18916.1 hypothetical protein IF561_27210 [Vibrio parahaemolyticus]